MARKIIYGEAKPYWRLTFEVNGKQYEADGYESEYFACELPEGKYDYYARHDDSDWTEIVGIKKYKGADGELLGYGGNRRADRLRKTC